MKKMYCFVVLFLYLMGTIGGFGYAMYCKAYVIAAAVVVLALMAFPTAQKYYDYLTD